MRGSQNSAAVLVGGPYSWFSGGKMAQVLNFELRNRLKTIINPLNLRKNTNKKEILEKPKENKRNKKLKRKELKKKVKQVNNL